MNYITQKDDKKLIKLGDTCVIYISEHNRNILRVEQDVEIQTKFGLLKASDLIGQPYGVMYNLKRGWIIPLRLTPEQWTQLLPHRTQILYQADISMILLQLDIKPGSVVVESGTGSGSLSHAILRAISPNGFLHTFDLSESRVAEARKEFHDHGYGNLVEVNCRNVCESGYGEALEGKADACILDLPQTWSAIEHAFKVLKPDGSRLCTFSPCIEQVQQNVAKMTELKLKDIVTMECLLRPFDIKVQKLRTWNEDVLEGLRQIDQVRIENLKSNLQTVKQAKTSNGSPEATQTSEMREPLKFESNAGDGFEPLNNALSNPKAQFNPHMLPKSSHLHAKQQNETVSHSGYLTFASKRP